MERIIKRNEMIAYAMDFAAYLLSHMDGIDRIILHGSVARGDFDEESDVDLFIDSSEKNIENKISKILDDYYSATRFKEWKLKGIESPISFIAGKLDSTEWKDLKRAIMNTGYILYGKYKAEADKIHHYTLFSFENIKPDKKRVAIFRKLFGFSFGKKNFPGIVEKFGGIRIGKGSVLIPIEHVNELKKYLQEKKVSFRLYDLWSDDKIGG